MRRQVVLVVADVDLQVAEQRHELRVGLESVQVGAHRAPAVDADQPREGLRVVPRVLERLPRGLEEETLLRVEALGLARAEAEEVRVEQLETVEHASGGDEVGVEKRVQVDARAFELVNGERTDRLDAVAEVHPELGQVGCSGKPAAHPDDRNGLPSPRFLRPSHRNRPLCWVYHALALRRPGVRTGLLPTRQESWSRTVASGLLHLHGSSAQLQLAVGQQPHRMILSWPPDDHRYGGGRVR